MARFNQFIKKVKFNGIVFDSNEECEYYKILLERLAKKEISTLEVHKIFVLLEDYRLENGTEIKGINYEADFVFYDTLLGRMRFVDIKGFKDEVFNLKKKLFEFKTGVELEVIKFDIVAGFVPYQQGRKLIKERKKKRAEEKQQKIIDNMVKKQNREKQTLAKNIKRYNELSQKSILTAKQAEEKEKLSQKLIDYIK